jgi:hypothetical protein
LQTSGLFSFIRPVERNCKSPPEPCIRDVFSHFSLLSDLSLFSSLKPDGLRTFVERDFADAVLLPLSADRRFATVYKAALQTAKVVIRLRWLPHSQYAGSSSAPL